MRREFEGLFCKALTLKQNVKNYKHPTSSMLSDEARGPDDSYNSDDYPKYI